MSVSDRFINNPNQMTHCIVSTMPERRSETVNNGHADYIMMIHNYYVWNMSD